MYPYPHRNPARGVKFLVFAVIIGMIALLRQAGIERSTPLGLGLIGLAVLTLAIVLRWVFTKWLVAQERDEVSEQAREK